MMPVEYVDITNAEDVGQRIDNFLLRSLKGLPRQRIYKILRSGEVRVNGGRIKPSYRLELGDRIRIPPVTVKAEQPVQMADATVEMLEAAIDIDDNFSEAHAFNGIASMRIGRYEDAEESFDIALEIAEENNDLDSLSTAYNFLGIYYKIRGHLRKAVRNFEKGLKIHKETNNKIKECNILNNLADCYSKMRKNEQAIEFIERIIPEYEKREEFEYLANSYGNLGNAYKNMGQLTNALEYYSKSSALCVKTTRAYNSCTKIFRPTGWSPIQVLMDLGTGNAKPQ